MLKQLVKVANKLDMLDMYDEADTVDGIITHVYNDLGDFSNLDKTNISPDEAFSAGYSVSEIKHEGSYMAKQQLAEIHELSSKLYFLIEDGEQIDDWKESYIAEIASKLDDVYKKMKYHKSEYGIQKFEKESLL